MQRGERGSGAVAAASLLGCLLIGALGGYAAARVTAAQPDELPSAVPLEAVSPSVPTDPPIDTVPDSDLHPTLGTDLTYMTKRIGTGTNRWRYDVPRGLEPADHEQGGIRWTLPGSPAFTFSMRVAIINTLPITPAQAARNRMVNVRGLEGYAQVSLTDDSLVFTYVDQQHLRYQSSHWVAEPGSGRLGFEITVSGRLRDRPGLDGLLEHLVATTRQTG